METDKIKEQFYNRDRCVRVLSKNGMVRAVCIKNTTTARTAQEKHKLDHVPAFVLAKALAAASMISSFLKGEERVTLDINGNGIIETVFAEALQAGETRGFVNLADDIDTRVINNASEVLGLGLLRVSQYIYNKSEPIYGIIPLEKGDIATDLSFYFTQSEQIPTAVILDVDFDEVGLINFSGGLMVQAMPGHTEEDLKEVYEKINQIKSFKEVFKQYKNPADVLSFILPIEFNIISSVAVDFFCRCNKEAFMTKLITLDVNEIKDMQKVGHNELVCHYCNAHYYLDDKDFNRVIEDAQAKKN